MNKNNNDKNVAERKCTIPDAVPGMYYNKRQGKKHCGTDALPYRVGRCERIYRGIAIYIGTPIKGRF